MLWKYFMQIEDELFSNVLTTGMDRIGNPSQVGVAEWLYVWYTEEDDSPTVMTFRKLIFITIFLD